MASADYYLKIEGVEGESRDRGHKGSIEVLSWSWGANQLGVTGGGGSTGVPPDKFSMNPFEFTKKIDKSTPILLTSAATGKHFPKVELTVRKGGSHPASYMKYTFTDCLVSSIQGHTAEPRLPVERVSFNFLKVELSVQQFGGKGLFGSPVTGEFVETSDGAAG